MRVGSSEIKSNDWESNEPQERFASPKGLNWEAFFRFSPIILGLVLSYSILAYISSYDLITVLLGTPIILVLIMFAVSKKVVYRVFPDSLVIEMGNSRSIVHLDKIEHLEMKWNPVTGRNLFLKGAGRATPILGFVDVKAVAKALIEKRRSLKLIETPARWYLHPIAMFFYSTALSPLIILAKDFLNAPVILAIFGVTIPLIIRFASAKSLAEPLE